MSFLSSHRLHWGVHHELTDNFWLQVERMVRPETDTSAAENTVSGPPAHAGDGTHQSAPKTDVLEP